MTGYGLTSIVLLLEELSKHSRLEDSFSQKQTNWMNSEIIYYGT